MYINHLPPVTISGIDITPEMPANMRAKQFVNLLPKNGWFIIARHRRLAGISTAANRKVLRNVFPERLPAFKEYA